MKKGYNLDVVYRYMDKYDLTCTEFCKRCGITLVTFNHLGAAETFAYVQYTVSPRQSA